MKKIISFVFIISLIVPNIAFASEGLFYYFQNEYGLKSYKSNSDVVDVLAPQIYEVGYDLKINRPKSTKILNEAKKKDAKVVPLLVNKAFDKVLMSDILLNQKAQDEIIDFMIKEAKKRNFAGWQFDFENINHLDRGMYVDFVAKTYQKMKENNLEFSVAVVVRSNDYDPNSENQDWSSAYDYKKLAQNSDFLSLMTYDDPNSEGPVSSLDYVNRVLNYIETQAPADKLSLGIPLYCWKWQDGKRAGATTYRLAEKEYRKYKKGHERGYDEKYGAEYFKFNKKGADTIVWCDSVKSFETKLDIIDKRGLRGFSAWALGQEDSDIWDLLEDRKTE